MKNFLRALRFSLPYRGRLMLSFVCALFAAVLWSLTFTAISPVHTLLTEQVSLQTSVDKHIEQVSAEIAKLQPILEGKKNRYKLLESQPATDYRDKQLRDDARSLAKDESKLDGLTTDLYRQRQMKRVVSFLPNDPFETLAWVFGFVLVVVAIKGVFEFGQDTLVGSVVNLSLFDMRNRFYRKVLHLDVDQFGEQGSSKLMSHFTNDMELLGQGTKTLFGKLVSEPLKTIACVAAACWISWQLTFMFLVLVPVAFFLLTKLGRMMKRATRRLLERMSNIYKILQETFQGIRVVKAFTTEPHERRRFRGATREYYQKAMLVVNIDALTSPLIEVLGVAAVSGALLAGAYLVLENQTHLFGMRMTNQPLGAAALLQLYGYLAAIADPVRKLSSVYTKLQSGAAAADRIFAFADKEPRVRANSDGRRLERHNKSIEFRDVCFSYDPGRPILTNVSLQVRFGETIALVGKNGSGKTSLVGLIARFYDTDHGSICVDECDIRTANLRSLRQQIGLVTQDTLLFDENIFNNIAYGHRHATREQVEEAAHRAFAHEFIMKLEKGYETRVGEAGAKLSGGQRQRLALARAILRNPSILILDEFTSQYDTESEALIHRALKEFTRDRTTFVITHRLNTLEIADRIVVLENGRIAAVGTHPELLGTCPAYQRLHEAQFQRLCA